jgi:hypothetical protein
MKYVKRGSLLDRKGAPIVVPTSEPFELTIEWSLATIMNAYIPTQKFILNMQDLRKFNRCFDVLEDTSKDVMAFEDEDFKVLLSIVQNVAPMMLLPHIVRNAPQIEDVLTNAPSKYVKGK